MRLVLKMLTLAGVSLIFLFLMFLGLANNQENIFKVGFFGMPIALTVSIHFLYYTDKEINLSHLAKLILIGIAIGIVFFAVCYLLLLTVLSRINR